GATALAGLLCGLGPAGGPEGGQRLAVGVVERPAAAAGPVADRAGAGDDLEPAAPAPAQRGGREQPRGRAAVGRAGALPGRGRAAGAAGRGGPGAAGGVPARVGPAAAAGLPGLAAFGAALQRDLGGAALVVGAGAGAPGRLRGAAAGGRQRQGRAVRRQAV